MLIETLPRPCYRPPAAGCRRTKRTTMIQATKDLRADALVGSYARAGYAPASPAILQPADPFVDLSGEDIRRRMYLVSDQAGPELCLRPDLTIPVALDYLASPAAGRPASFCYLGPIFRQRDDGPAEIGRASCR